MRIEQLVLKHLINNEDYARKTIPFLQKEYFSDSTEGLVFEKIKKFINDYLFKKKFTNGCKCSMP